MKFPFSFSLKFVFRLILPGSLLTLGFLPIIIVLVQLYSVDVEIIPLEAILFLTTIIFGWLLIVLDMHIYMLYEGRRYWPSWLYKRLLSWEMRRLKKIENRYNLAVEYLFEDGSIKDNNSFSYKENYNRYLENSVRLRSFPIDEMGQRTAVSPTRLGNLLYSYESYPEIAYGADAVFYWYRIWLLIDKDQQEQLDSQQAITDSTIYSSFSIFISAILCSAYSVLAYFNINFFNFLPGVLQLGLTSCALFFLSYLLYRISLQAHATFGEYFKALFDVYLRKVKVNHITLLLISQKIRI